MIPGHYYSIITEGDNTLVATARPALHFGFFMRKSLDDSYVKLPRCDTHFFWQKGARISEYETLHAVIIANMDLRWKNVLDPNSP